MKQFWKQLIIKISPIIVVVIFIFTAWIIFLNRMNPKESLEKAMGELKNPNEKDEHNRSINLRNAINSLWNDTIKKYK